MVSQIDPLVLFQINKGSSQIRVAIPYLTDQIRAKVSLALIYSGLPLFDLILSRKRGRSSHAEDTCAVSSLEREDLNEKIERKCNCSFGAFFSAELRGRKVPVKIAKFEEKKDEHREQFKEWLYLFM